MAINFIPTKHLADAMPKMLAGKGFSTVSGDLINIIIWCVLFHYSLYGGLQKETMD